MVESKFGGNITQTSICFPSVVFTHRFSDLPSFILDKTSLEIYKDKEKIINDYEKLPWLKYVQDVHENPSFYLTNWDYDTYGDSEYLAKVLSYCTSDEAHYIYDDSNVTFNLRYGATKSERYRQR